ncbi:hypothetical protein NBC122_02110 [Chryseobacterium salivictor]|uniref:Uncharacterized protein n=1 Tax=Chryseobacterium salivictor TaxID=2547600 RepID=A0A4P6ZH73_9FLAO|nr:hypothetical protein NBC122_02110 [Chryseobacterium salivictor]
MRNLRPGLNGALFILAAEQSRSHQYKKAGVEDGKVAQIML